MTTPTSGDLNPFARPKSEDGSDQFVYYARGVNGFWGGTVGKGLDDLIKGGYEWLIDQYESGDEVFIFGFSRGAYAARSLAGTYYEMRPPKIRRRFGC